MRKEKLRMLNFTQKDWKTIKNHKDRYVKKVMTSHQGVKQKQLDKMRERAIFEESMNIYRADKDYESRTKEVLAKTVPTKMNELKNIIAKEKEKSIFKNEEEYNAHMAKYNNKSQMKTYIRGAITTDVRIKKAKEDIFGDEKSSITEITRKFMGRMLKNKDNRIPPDWVYNMPIQKRQV